MSALVLLEDCTLEFTWAAEWERDDSGHLTIFDADGDILAEFAPGGWEGIISGQDDADDDEPDDELAGFLKAIFSEVAAEYLGEAEGASGNKEPSPDFPDAGVDLEVDLDTVLDPYSAVGHQVYPEGHELAGQPKFINAG